MAKPTVFIVGGAWHTADYLDPLAQVFEAAGYPAKTIGLPSVGANPPAKDFSGDVAEVRNATTELIAEKKDVIAILHSLAGISGTEALHGLSKASTGGAGVLAIVYIASMVPQKGNSFDDHSVTVGNHGWKPAKENFSKDGLMALPVEFAMGMFYNGVEEDEAKRWASLLKPQSIGVYDSPLTHETYKEIPSAYILTTNDNAFQHDFQVKTVELAGFPKSMTKTLDTGHAPWLTKPQEVKQFVLQVASEVDG